MPEMMEVAGPEVEPAVKVEQEVQVKSEVHAKRDIAAIPDR